jgi:hypothetical protein
MSPRSLLTAAVVVGVTVGLAACAGGQTPAASQSASSSGGASSSEPPSTPTSTAPPTPSGPKTTFSDGTWEVNKQIAPGTYWTKGGPNCYWERESNLTGDTSAIIANGNTIGQVIVTIAPSDLDPRVRVQAGVGFPPEPGKRAC